MKDCKYCGFPMEVHDREHLATECYPKQIDALREALEFYADQENWKQKFVKREDGQIIMRVKAHIAKYKVAQEALQQSPRKGRK